MNAFVYAFIALVTFACAALLARGYLKARVRMLFWSALCFAGLTVANAILFVDLVMLPAVDLYVLRLAITTASLAVLVYGFIWESDTP
jgi:hypothetical protein